MKKHFLKSLFLTFALCSSLAQAGEAEIAAAVKRLFGMQATAVRESLIPGLYGVNTSASEVGPRLFIDKGLTIYGNYSTGYTHITGPRRGQDLSPQEAQELFRSMLSAIPKERLITYRFGNGVREVLLFTAYDCPICRGIEQALQQRSKDLNATVYLIPTGLHYQTDAAARRSVQSLLCAPDRELAWQNLILTKQAPASGNCAERADDYAYLTRAFPVKFPGFVPVAVTLADAKIHSSVQQQFQEIFGVR